MKWRAYPRQEGTPGSVWSMNIGNGCWAYVLCVGERRPQVGNFPCLMLACSSVGWSKAYPGSVINVSLGGSRTWKRMM